MLIWSQSSCELTRNWERDKSLSTWLLARPCIPASCFCFHVYVDIFYGGEQWNCGRLKWTPWSEVVDDWRRQVEVQGLSGSRRVESRSVQVDQATPISELASEGLYFAVFEYFLNVCDIIIACLRTSSKVCLKLWNFFSNIMCFTYRIHILLESSFKMVYGSLIL